MSRFSVGAIVLAWALAVSAIAPMSVMAQGQPADEAKSQFEQRYAALHAYLTSHEPSLEDPLLTEGGWTLYLELTALGPPALPYMIEKIEEGDWRLGGCVSMITKKHFERSEYADPRYYGGSITKAGMYVEWWREGRQATGEQFENLYRQWKTLLQQGQDQAAADTYVKMRRLGIAALPSAIEKIQQGDGDLIPLVAYLTSGPGGAPEAARQWATPAECLDWWNANKEAWTLPPAKQVQWAPARAAAALAAASVYWDEVKRAAVFSTGGHRLVVRPGEATAMIDGQALQLEGVPYIEKDRLMVPLSALTQAFGVTLSPGRIEQVTSQVSG